MAVRVLPRAVGHFAPHSRLLALRAGRGAPAAQAVREASVGDVGGVVGEEHHVRRVNQALASRLRFLDEVQLELVIVGTSLEVADEARVEAGGVGGAEGRVSFVIAAVDRLVKLLRNLHDLRFPR